mmetsp:Transcript_24951/g.83846  ORF Transcript_24951/g.83846 Transcript_24951/m.83846 type:complete len:210 (-) Transcript_24951:438-1067(-)
MTLSARATWQTASWKKQKSSNPVPASALENVRLSESKSSARPYSPSPQKTKGLACSPKTSSGALGKCTLAVSASVVRKCATRSARARASPYVRSASWAQSKTSCFFAKVARLRQSRTRCARLKPPCPGSGRNCAETRRCRSTDDSTIASDAPLETPPARKSASKMVFTEAAQGAPRASVEKCRRSRGLMAPLSGSKQATYCESENRFTA